MPTISFLNILKAASDPDGELKGAEADILLVQKALKMTVGLNYGAGGIWGPKTKTAYKKYQKTLYGDSPSAVDGIPGPDSLTRLGQATKLYTVVDIPKVTKPAKAVAAVKKVVSKTVKSPVPGHLVTYAYGLKNSRYAAGYHTGADYAARTGTPVVAVRSGRIIRSDSAGGAYGNWIQLLGDDGHVYMYAHLSVRQVSVGQRVTAGQQIGKVGATGNVTGPHLHFEKSRGSSWRYGWVQKPTW